ncbi:uncharacterized protein LOC142335257 [Convolutriloba macropyga]|uniref:uncharacterized protein LOC142335257 n=1 Tax=Convolutriloba macropyga TaxID=536237 RepID=UPI003F524BC3
MTVAVAAIPSIIETDLNVPNTTPVHCPNPIKSPLIKQRTVPKQASFHRRPSLSVTNVNRTPYASRPTSIIREELPFGGGSNEISKSNELGDVTTVILSAESQTSISPASRRYFDAKHKLKHLQRQTSLMPMEEIEQKRQQQYQFQDFGEIVDYVVTYSKQERTKSITSVN